MYVQRWDICPWTTNRNDGLTTPTMPGTIVFGLAEVQDVQPKHIRGWMCSNRALS